MENKQLPADVNETIEAAADRISDKLMEIVKEQLGVSNPGPHWVKVSAELEYDFEKINHKTHWRRAEDKKPLLVIGWNYQHNIIAQFGKVYRPEELEYLDESTDYQQLKARADRYEKALNDILNTNHDNYERVILKVKAIATEALNGKEVGNG